MWMKARRIFQAFINVFINLITRIGLHTSIYRHVLFMRCRAAGPGYIYYRGFLTWIALGSLLARTMDHGRLDDRSGGVVVVPRGSTILYDLSRKEYQKTEMGKSMLLVFDHPDTDNSRVYYL
jgi:hypothetical protein